MKKPAVIFSALVACPLFYACSTMVPVEVMKPAEINMGNMKTIAILNFGYPALGDGGASVELIIRDIIARQRGFAHVRNREQERIAKYATDRMISVLIDTGYFTIMDPSNIAGAVIRADKLTLSPVELGGLLGVDALVAGGITDLSADTTSSQTQTKDAKGRPVFTTHYRKTARLAFTYRIINAKTGQVVAVREWWGTASGADTDADNLPSDEDLYRGILDDLLERVPRQLVPYKVTEYRILMADNTKDDEMKRLDELTKKKFYKEARDGYLAVWEKKRNVAAGYNAAIMREITGDIDGAVALMTEVAAETKSPEAIREIERLQKTKAEAEAAAAQQ